MARPYRVTIYDTMLERAFDRDAKPWNRRKARAVEARARVLAPTRSYTLRASHGTEQNRDRLGRFQSGFYVYANARHAAWVHGGTGAKDGKGGAKVIRPRVKKAMVLPAGAGYPRLITKAVAGQKPNNWLERAAEGVL